MNWYTGNIAEAVNLSVQRKAIFVVYVDGKDDLSKKLTSYIDQTSIKTKLESESFVSIRVEGGSESYMQFASIYKMVPIPSIFFIGENGTPLEVVTGLIASADELEQKIQHVVSLAGKSGSVAAPSADLIAAESAASSKAASPLPAAVVTEPSKPAVVPVAKPVDDPIAKPAEKVEEPKPSGSTQPEVVCENGVCSLKPKSVEPVAKPENDKDAEKKRIEMETKAAYEARVERARKLLEEKRKEREAEEAQEAREKELKRRKEGKDVTHLKSWQKEQEMKELKENIRREREAEQAARQRILAQIAGDRAERAKVGQPTPSGDAAAAVAKPDSASKPNTESSTVTRIQFRVPSGDAHTHTFNNTDNFGTIREHVQTKIVQGTGIKEFSLATTFPRREFKIEDDSKTLVELELCPTAVILVISRGNSGASAVIAKSGGVVNIFNTLFWSVLSPLFAVFGFLKNFVTGGGGAPRPGAADRAATGAQKRASEEERTHHDLAKKRNLDRLTANKVNDGASTSKTSTSSDEKPAPYRRYGGSNIHRLADQKDSDDDNATWNGNSTQQQ